MAPAAFPRVVGRYVIGGMVAKGGMATLHLGRSVGAHGFARVVAVKRMLPHFAGDPEFVAMFLDEARLAARVRHPNVVPTFDVVAEGDDVCIVMEYVHGVTLWQLLKRAKAGGVRIPPEMGATLLRETLEGLHAAHEAVDESGRPLGIVHRDVSPHNVLVGADGIARVLDFGIAKANVRLHQTRTGDTLKGKLAYMAPEQLEGKPVSRVSDVFAASVVLWETLTGERLHAGANEGETVLRVMQSRPRRPSEVAPEIGTAFDEVVLRGLAREPAERFPTARDMALALAEVGATATAPAIAEWLRGIADEDLTKRSTQLRELEEELSAPRATGPVADPEATRSAVHVWTPEPKRKRLRTGVAVAAAAIGASLVALAVARPHAGVSRTPPTPTIASTAPVPPASSFDGVDAATGVKVSESAPESSASVAPAPQKPRSTPSHPPRAPTRPATTTLPDHL
ncbi:MAG TPA: protein kinase [Polyangiaceae bacterium]